MPLPWQALTTIKCLLLLLKIVHNRTEIPYLRGSQSMSMKQTILGAGGAIGVELAKALSVFTSDIRLVGRNPKKVNRMMNSLPQTSLIERKC